MSVNMPKKRPMAAFEFENPGRADLVLSWGELEKIQQLDGSDSTKIWEALGTLTAHLDDPFLEVEALKLPDVRPRLMTVFDFETPVGPIVGYAIVTLNGRIFVGNAERLSSTGPVSLQLEEFDVEKDDLTSIAVTSSRLVGDRLDLWIGIRRQLSESEPRPAEGIFHALIWFDKSGLPHLDAPVDDSGARCLKRYSAERFPEWFCRWRLRCMGGRFEKELPEEISQKLDELVRGADISAVIWHVPSTVEDSENDDSPRTETAFPDPVDDEKHLFLCALDERLIVLRAEGGLLLPDRWSRERLRTIAMPERANSAVPSIVLGLHAHSLVGLDWTHGDNGSWKLERRWAKRIPFLPNALRFFPVNSANRQDLLVADGEGCLHRLRLIDVAHIRASWERCWSLLKAPTLQERVKLVPPAQLQSLRRAWLLGIVEKALQHAAAADTEPAELSKILKTIQELFNLDESDFVLLPAIQLLLQDLEGKAQEPLGWGVLPEGDFFLPRFLFGLYDRCTPVMLRGLIDSQVRELSGNLKTAKSEAVQELLFRSERSRRDLWNMKETDKDKVAVVWVGFGLERWASACILAYSWRRLPLKKSDEDVCTAVLPVFQEEGSIAATIYLAGNGEIGRLIVDREMRGQRGKGIFGESIFDPIVALERIEGQLFVIDRGGSLHFFRGEQECFGKCAVLPEREDLRAWAFGTLTSREGLRTATLFGKGLESLLALGELRGSSYKSIAQKSLGLRRARAMALAGDGKEWVVALGSSLPSSIHVLYLRESGEERQTLHPCYIKAGVSCLTFEKREQPRFLFCGDRSGFVWCVDVRAEPAKIRWTYKAKSMIRAFCPFSLDGEDRLLVGSEDGDLCLLDCLTGRRLWKTQMLAPIQTLSVAGTIVVILVRGGLLALYEILPNSLRAAALESCIKAIQKLGVPKEGDGRWDHNDADPVRVFSHLFGTENQVLDSGTFLAALASGRSRVGRARLIRWLVLESSKSVEIEPILQQLTFRELGLLISYLPDEETSWDLAIAAELRRRGWTSNLLVRGDDSSRSRETVWVYWIQRKARQEVPLREIVVEGLDGRWLRLELARLLWLQARRKAAHGNPQLALFFMLLHWPPNLLVEIEEIVPKEEEALSSFLRILTGLVGALKSDSAPQPETLLSLGKLAELGKPLKGQRGEKTALFLAALARFLHLFGSLAQEEFRQAADRESQHKELAHHGWLIEVDACYKKMIRLMGEVGAELGTLHEELRWLPKAPVADATESLESRLIAVERSLRQFEKELSESGEGIEKRYPWWLLSRHLNRWIWWAVRQWLQVEHRFLLELVRPRLTLQGVSLDDSQVLRLHLRAEPEGTRQLQDVSLHFEIQEAWRKEPTPPSLSLLTYPGRRPPYEFVLEGYLPPGTRQVSVQVEMAAERGYQFRETWEFSLQDALQRRQRLRVAQQLPECFQSFVNAVLASKAALVLVSIDANLGRPEFLRELERRKAVTFDLDGWMRDYGPGRKYAMKPLDLDLWREAFTEAQARAGELRTSPLVIGPTSETLGRWLAYNQKADFVGWWRELRERKAGERQLIVVTSSLHAALLRQMGLGKAVELAFHRWPSESKDRGLLTLELKQTLEHETKLEAGWADRLGGDLRLLERALLFLDQRGRPPAALAEFFTDEDVTTIFKLELASLEPIVLIAVIVGALAETRIALSQIRAGHVAASEQYSNTRGASRSKLLVSRGQILTGDILNRVRSDPRPPDQLSLEGLGLEGTITCRQSRLDRLFQTGAKARRLKAFEAAASLGMGEMVGTVFRTSSPWRERIRKTYDELTLNDRRDSLAYRDLLGGQRHPTELLDAQKVLDMEVEDLAQILPEAGREDLANLRQLARLLLGKEADVEAWLRKVFEKARVTRLSDLEESGRQAFAAIECSGWQVSSTDTSGAYYFWIEEYSRDLHRRFAEAIETFRSTLQGAEARKPPRIALLGPGLQGQEPDDRRRFGLLRLEDAVEAAWDGDLAQGLERKLRVQHSLSAYSPFQLQAALPPGSGLFVGREKELEFIRGRIQLSSFLILGARRIGKTSLLNAVFDWAKQQSEIAAFQLDLQGVTTGQELYGALAAKYGRQKGASNVVRELAEKAKNEGKLAVFFFNEIDGLATHDSEVLVLLRGLNDEGLARFVMTGYYIIVQLGDPKDALFHFSTGTHVGGKATVLSVLEESAARRLLAKLEVAELGLRWATAEDQNEGEKLLLEKSYRVPWALQQYAHNLVEHMEQERRFKIRVDDVEAVMAGEKGGIVWNYIDAIEYQKLMPTSEKGAQRYPEAFRLLLYAIARSRYFLGGRNAPIRDGRLRFRRPVDLGFTTAEAIEALDRALEQLVKVEELRLLREYFASFNFDDALRLLTLTMALEPDPVHNNRWIFSLHIVPLELKEFRSENDPTLDGLVVTVTADLLSRIR